MLIQGVELGQHFVLLDTPGLHSEVVENGELTQRFLDSADAVLWLTPSTSPRQVQELTDLKVELEKGKPLLPIITHSDKVEEDWSEELQDIVSIYLDKDSDNRSLQENDVKMRLGEFKDIHLNEVKDPISISVFTYKQHFDLAKSGLERLFQQMSDLIAEAANYKGNKAVKQVENFINTHVVAKLNQLKNEQIEPVKQETKQVLTDLNNSQISIESSVRLSVFNKLPAIILKNKVTRSKDGVIKDVSEVINETLNKELSEKLSRFIKSVENVSAQLDSQNIADYKAITIERKEITGSGYKSVGAGLGGAGGVSAGAALGSLLGPAGTIAGGILGGIVGGYVGNKAGEFFVETRNVTEEVGLSTEAMENDLKNELTQKIQQIVAKVIEETQQQIQPLETVCDNLLQEIEQVKKVVGKA